MSETFFAYESSITKSSVFMMVDTRLCAIRQALKFILCGRQTNIN